MTANRTAAWLSVAPAGTHLVGGALRDRLRGQFPTDLDWAVPDDALAVAHRFAQATDGHLVVLDPARGIARVVWPEASEQYDIVPLTGGSIATDLARRDLTINAMAMPLSEQALAWLADPVRPTPATLVDPYGGQSDLRARQIRALSEANLLDDPLRLLRVFRFASRTGFTIAADTLAWVRQHGHRIGRVAPERVAHEVYQLFAGQAGPVLKQMQETGFLLDLWPEMRPMLDVPPNQHHHLDVLSHSVEVAWQLERVLAGATAFGPLGPDVDDYLATELAHGRRIGPWLKAAALWHDLGKPATYTLEGDRARFTGHDKVGATIMTSLGERLRLSQHESRWLSLMVAQHLRPGHLLNAPVTPRALYRFYRELGHDSLGVALLAWADRLGTQGPAITAADNRAMVEMAHSLIDGYREWAAPLAAAPPLVDGRQLMAALGWQPGPHVGRMLVRLREAQALGEIGDTDAAIAQARQWVAEAERA